MICTHAIWLNHHLWRGKNCTAVDTQHIPLFKHVKHFFYGWLVVSTPLKNMKVSWDNYSQYMEK